MVRGFWRSLKLDKKQPDKTSAAAAKRRVRGDAARTRGLLLDATERVMISEGYASVSTRRVARQVGLSSSAVHYYFPTTDDLLGAAYLRAAQRHDDCIDQAFRSDRPLHALWSFHSDSHRMALGVEFMAMATHRKVIRGMIREHNDKDRRRQVAALTTLLKDCDLAIGGHPATIVMMTLLGIGRGLVVDDVLGLSLAHAETRRRIEKFIEQIEQLRRRGCSRSHNVRTHRTEPVSGFIGCVGSKGERPSRTPLTEFDGPGALFAVRPAKDTSSLDARRERRGAAEATRARLLDATERLMLSEGYAAVTSRRVAGMVGLTPPLVHYHYRTTEDLLIAAYRRAIERHDRCVREAAAGENPVRALWNLCSDPTHMALGVEFMAMANHRRSIRHEICRHSEEERKVHASVFTRYLARDASDLWGCSPACIAMMMSGIARLLVMDQVLDVSYAHAELRAFIQSKLIQLEVSQRACGSGKSMPVG